MKSDTYNQDGNIPIVSAPTSVKVLVRRLANESDLLERSARFLVPQMAGYRLARFICKKDGAYYFDFNLNPVCALLFELPRFNSLDNIYLV